MAIKRILTTIKKLMTACDEEEKFWRERERRKSQTIYSIKLFQGYVVFLYSFHVCHVQIIKYLLMYFYELLYVAFYFQLFYFLHLRHVDASLSFNFFSFFISLFLIFIILSCVAKLHASSSMHQHSFYVAVL